MVDVQGEVLWNLGEAEVLAEPDITCVPVGMDDGTRRTIGAETSGALLPLAVVETNLEPVVAGILDGVFPSLTRLAGVWKKKKVLAALLGISRRHYLEADLRVLFL